VLACDTQSSPAFCLVPLHTSKILSESFARKDAQDSHSLREHLILYNAVLWNQIQGDSPLVTVQSTMVRAA
jgi:hypothetical protein